jgi:hypothetical protein
VVVSDVWAARAFDREWIERPGGAPATAAMLAVKKVADAFSASASVSAARRGTSITLTMPIA